MSTGALTRIQRLALGAESTIYDTPSSFENISAIEAVTATASRAPLADNRQLTSRKAQHASHLGEKAFDSSFTVPLHQDITDQLDDVLTTALGSKAGGSLVGPFAGTEATVTSVGGGTFDPIVKITLSDGSVFVRPVKSVTGNVATLAIRLPTLGARTVTNVENAVSTGGACYIQDPDGAVTTFHVEIDRDGEPDQVPYIGKGCAVTAATIALNLTARLTLQVSMSGGDWSQETPTNTAAPAEISGQQLGYAAEAFLQDIGTPSAGVQLDLNTITMNLASQALPVRATRAVLADGSVPGSAITHYKRGLFAPDAVQLTLAVADASYVADRTNKTPKGLFLCFTAGGPGDTSALFRMAIFYPRVVLDADPTLTDIDGIEAMQLSYRVEEQALVAPYLTQCSISFFK